MTSTDTTNKPFQIDKRRVYEAYKAVKSNGGAAGVDRQTIEQFEADLGGNLYKIWNRMSSGTYFPPPVLAVSIPKKSSQIPDGMVIVLRLTAPKNRMMLLSVPLAKGDGSQVCSGLAAGARGIRTVGPPGEMTQQATNVGAPVGKLLFIEALGHAR